MKMDTEKSAKDKVDEALAEKKGDDWLAAFSKKCNEALAKRAEEKRSEPRPDEKEVVRALARTDAIEYDRIRVPVADEMGIRVGT